MADVRGLASRVKKLERTGSSPVAVTNTAIDQIALAVCVGTAAEYVLTRGLKSKSPAGEGWAKCLIRVVGREWLEHSTYGLRVRCSTN